MKEKAQNASGSNFMAVWTSYKLEGIIYKRIEPGMNTLVLIVPSG